MSEHFSEPWMRLDDVVFSAFDDTFAIVHLVWTTKRDTPPWPCSVRLGSVIAVERAMEQYEH